MNTSRRFAPWMVPLTAILLGTSVHKAFAQEQPPAPAQPAAAVPTGTRFLVRLEDELNTAKVQKNKRFKVHTLEPLEAGNGITIPTGAEIRGHVSGVEPGGLTGRARLGNLPRRESSGRAQQDESGPPQTVRRKARNRTD